MLYNLTGILSSEEKVEKLTVPYEHETVSNGLDSYKILEKSDLTLTLANKAKGEAEAEGEISLVCEIPCDRCLKPVKVSFSLKINFLTIFCIINMYTIIQIMRGFDIFTVSINII